MTALVLPPTTAIAPLVASLPHGGETIPPWARARMRKTDADLYADWFTAELYAFLPGLGVPCVVAQESRFVADPNRNPAQRLFAPFPEGLIASTVSGDGEALYDRPLTAHEIEARVNRNHRPFHQALEEAVDTGVAAFGRVLLVDLHSFGRPLNADVVLGDRHGATATPDTTALIHNAFSSAGFTVERNIPFPGGWIVGRYADVPEVEAVQIELNQRTYCDAAEIDRLNGRRPTRNSEHIAAATRRLTTVLSEIVTAFSGPA